MKLRTQYGDYIKVMCDEPVMPSEIKAELDRRLDAIKMHVGGEEVSREFLWLPAPSAPSDPLGQEACAGAKLLIEQEVDRDSYVAAIAAEGWRPFADVSPSGLRLELRDVVLDGKVERYARPSTPQ
jgi:hypothetical protein